MAIRGASFPERRWIYLAISVAMMAMPAAIAAEEAPLRPPCNSTADCLAAMERFTPGRSRTEDYGTWFPARVARIGGATAVPELRRLLVEARDQEVREAAAQTLGLLGPAAHPAIPDLARAANADNEDALIALVDLGAAEALDAAKKNFSTSYVATFSLLRLGAPGLAEAGRRLRSSDDVSILIKDLDGRPDDIKKLSDDILFAIRNRKSTQERLELAELLLRFGPADLREPIRTAIKDLRRSTNKLVRGGAEPILARAGDSAAMRSWVAKIGRRDQLGIINYDDYRAVCEMRDRAAAALPSLTRVAQTPASEDWDEQTLSVEAIGCIGTARAVPILIESLQSPSFRVVSAAVDALERIAPAEAEAPLDGLVKGHWHPAVREFAARALAAVRGHRLPPSPEPPVRWMPRGQEFACYGADWAPVSTPTVVVDRENPGTVPPRLKSIAGLSSYMQSIAGLSSYLPIRDGWLAAENKGEFGGGLYFVPSEDKDITKVSPGNFHYVAQRADGLIAVEGLGHLGTRRGAVWRIERRKQGFAARPWLELPSEPHGVHEAAQELIVVNTDLGPLAVDPNGQIATGPCRPLAAEATEVLQALLDSPQLQSALATQHAPVPLPVGLWQIEEDARGLTFRRRSVRSRRERPAAIDAGTFLQISGLSFDPSTAKAEAHFAYPDMAFVGRATFTRTNQRWRVASLRIAPLEKVRL